MNHYMLFAWEDFYPEGGISDLVSTIEAVDHDSARRIAKLRVERGDPKMRDEWQLLWINPETIKVEVIGHWVVEDKYSAEPKITEV